MQIFKVNTEFFLFDINRKCIVFNLQAGAVTELVNKTFFTLTIRVKKHFRNLS